MTPTKTRPPKAEIAAPVQGMATVTDVVQAPTPTILLDVIEGPARRAASCLLAPKAGDRVWFVRQGDACFVTAVLECAAEGPTCLDLPGDVTVRAAGSFTSGDIESMRLSGPIAPATKRGRSGVAIASQASRATRAPAALISRARSPVP